MLCRIDRRDSTLRLDIFPFSYTTVCMKSSKCVWVVENWKDFSKKWNNSNNNKERARENETKKKKNRAKQTLVTLTSQVHVNRDVNLFTESLQNSGPVKTEQSQHSIPKDPNWITRTHFVYLSVAHWWMLNWKLENEYVVCRQFENFHFTWIWNIFVSPIHIFCWFVFIFLVNIV